MATGKRSIMDVKQKLQGRHKKGHTFPINLLVSKVPGGSAVDDVNFMGIVIPRKDDDVVGVVNLSKSGIISAFNQACEQMFGYSSSEAPGKPFKRLLDKASVKAFEEAMGLAMATAGSNLERQLQGMHKSGKAFPVRVNMVADSLGGIVAKVESLDDAVGMITIDEVGQIRNANECVVQIFGHSSHELIDMNISQLMPRPYSMFHASYLKRYKSTKKSSVVGDPLGRVLNRVLNGLHKSGHQFAINLNVYSMEIANGSDEVLYSGRISLPKSGVDDVRTARCTIRNDGGIQQMAEHFEALYGVQPHTFIGCPLEELVAEFEPSEAGLVAALTALQPLENRRLTRQTSASSMGKASSEHEASSRSLRLDNSAADRRRGRPGGLSGRGVLSFGGTPILVFMTTEATMGPLANVVQMWAGHLMEGIIDITKGGIISRATFGVQILFGYHNDDLVGQNVSMLMPHSVAKHHDTFLKNYQEGGRGNLIGVRRIVDGKHHDGSALRLALEVCDTDEGSEVTTYRGEKAAFTARVVLSNDPVTETFLKVNGSDDEDANRCTGSGEGNGGGCAFAPGPPASPDPKDSGMGLEIPALKANPLATLIECDEREAPLLIEGDEREAPLTSLDGDDEGDEDGTPRPPAPVKFALDKYPDVGFLPTSSSSPNEALAQDEQANVGLIPALLTSPGPVTEGLSGDDSNLCWPSSKKQGGNCPFDSRGKDGYGGCPSAPASAASPQRDLVIPGGGCPFMASCGGRTLPLALQAQRRGGGGGCPFMSAETMDSHEADEFLRAQGCVVSDAPNSAGGPGPVVENYEHPDPSIDPQALAAAAAAAAASHARGRPPPPAPGIPALGAQKPRPPKLVRFLTPRQMQAMEEAEQEAGVDEPTEEETAYFQQQQMYATNDYDGYSIAPSPHGDEEYFGNGAGATTFLPGGQYADGGQFLPVDMDNCGPVPQTPYYPNPSLHPPGELPVHVQEGDGGQGNESDQSFNTEDEAAEALEKRKAKMRKEVTKAKKARRISKLLSSPKARRAMNQLRSHTKYVLVLLTALYITAFTIMQVLAQQHRVIMAKVETVSLMAGAVPISAIDARVLEAAHSGVLNVSKIDVQEELLRQAYIIEELG
jgi:PAS domain S-box-containing protein